MTMHFLDNTDPNGIDNVLFSIGAGNLPQTLCVVVSKSGGTKETRNGMLEAESAHKKSGLHFGRDAVAVTSQDSELDKLAVKNGWIRRFPMWDWVGGRTSELSAVGLLRAALQGIDIDAFLAGALACDEPARNQDVNANPAAQMTLIWHYYGNDKGSKNMVVLPYKDRLELFSKYLQLLLMEVGKKAATTVLALQTTLIDHLRKGARKAFTSAELAAGIGAPDEVETIKAAFINHL